MEPTSIGGKYDGGKEKELVVKKNMNCGLSRAYYQSHFWISHDKHCQMVEVASSLVKKSQQNRGWLTQKDNQNKPNMTENEFVVFPVKRSW